ncbi:MAG TPA: type I phosphomannose isomerase catalytic subunit [Verrucomicrobiae bacterium]|nr:type I phosphomannose isomerase catalytic subunit [Verrucomicrobiae bacterium]
MAASLYPLLFDPILKERIWGGRRLHELYGKSLPPGKPFGESWEISDRPGDISHVVNGPLAGKDLHWLVEQYGNELLGDVAPYKGRFPLLVKILDAQEKLSLQVHPPAEKARALGGEPKTEMWYIAEAAPGAQLYVGLKRGCSREEFAARIADGSVQGCFHKVAVRSGDAMFLPSGRVHAIGAGLVIFEIQQNSDTTYRVFDWNRLGLDGKPRELHVKESLESIRFDDFEPELLKSTAKPGRAPVVFLVENELFQVGSVALAQDQQLCLPEGEMHILGVISGHLTVRGGGESTDISAGGFCLIPAAAGDVAVHARAASTWLLVKGGKQESL